MNRWLIAAVTAVTLAAACSERLPTAFDTTPPPPPPPPWGLETRPVSSTCTGAVPPPIAPAARISFERVSPITFDQPVGVVAHGGRLYVIQQGSTSSGVTSGATIRILGADPNAAPTMVDVSSRTIAGGEAGLLGLAFHPKFAQNRFVFLYYTAPHPAPPAGVVFQSVVARYESPDGGLTLDLTTEKRILVVDQPFTNHNGGTIAFGNDGFLYFALGDGGSGGDPMNVAQNPNQLLGKIVRLDVDSGNPYAIPPTNPFAVSGGRPEIYALGFRNPYRFSFDVPTGDLWVGDVGQAVREEIDKVVLGGNYGWAVREGKLCFKPPSGCSTTGLIDPVVEHGREEAVAITGGVVYRGAKLPELTGKYIYGDSGLGSFWAIATNDPAPVPLRLELGLPNHKPVGFALDASGEVVFADYSGPLWRIAPVSARPTSPEKLSETGCADTTNPTKPAMGLFPYDVNVPQWLDGNAAERHLAIPGDAKITIKADGRLELPPGSVAIRTVRSARGPVETQLLRRRPTGEWTASSYVWNADGTDAALGPSTTCLTCHNEAAGVTLGLEAAQLDRSFPYPDRPANPLLTLEHVGMLSAPVSRESYMALPALDSYETVERRARAYLHANCAFCHQGREPADMDLRFSLPLPSTRTCDGKRVIPGNPAASTLIARMRARDATRMPPLGSSTPHEAAITVIEDWIRSVPSCQ